MNIRTSGSSTSAARAVSVKDLYTQAEKEGDKPDRLRIDPLAIFTTDRVISYGQPKTSLERSYEFHELEKFGNADAISKELGKRIKRRLSIGAGVALTAAAGAAVALAAGVSAWTAVPLAVLPLPVMGLADIGATPTPMLRGMQKQVEGLAHRFSRANQ